MKRLYTARASPIPAAPNGGKLTDGGEWLEYRHGGVVRRAGVTFNTGE